MKKLLTLFSLIFTLSVYGETVTVKIQGMTCMACVKSITKELKQVKDIEKESVKVSLKNEEAVFRTEGEVTDSKIRVAIKKAGYNVLKILRK